MIAREVFVAGGFVADHHQATSSQDGRAVMSYGAGADGWPGEVRVVRIDGAAPGWVAEIVDLEGARVEITDAWFDDPLGRGTRRPEPVSAKLVGVALKADLEKWLDAFSDWCAAEAEALGREIGEAVGKHHAHVADVEHGRLVVEDDARQRNLAEWGGLDAEDVAELRARGIECGSECEEIVEREAERVFAAKRGLQVSR